MNFFIKFINNYLLEKKLIIFILLIKKFITKIHLNKVINHYYPFGLG